jgi:hypothetical protein
MKNLIKSVEALSLKPDDFIIVTLKGFSCQDDLIEVREILKGMDLRNNALIVGGNVSIKSEGPTEGKHKVYLSNLEYLELLEKRKGGN